MIAGIILGISLTILLTSFALIVAAATGALKENVATGAVIGVSQISSYALIPLIFSLITTFLLVLYIRKSKN
jgi:hypothetical protein